MRVFTISLLILCSISSYGFAETPKYCPTPQTLESALKGLKSSEFLPSVFNTEGIKTDINNQAGKSLKLTINSVKIFADAGASGSSTLTKERVLASSGKVFCAYSSDKGHVLELNGDILKK